MQTQNLKNSRIAEENLEQKMQNSKIAEQKTQNSKTTEKIVIHPKIAKFEGAERDDLYKNPPQNLSFVSLLTAFGIVALMLALTLPKIFIANEIYYTSRDIGTLRDKLGVLNEENRKLKSELEAIRYKNQIIDNMN